MQHSITAAGRVKSGHLLTGTAVVQEDGAFVRVKLVNLSKTTTKVMALKQDLLYWPTWELRLDPAAATWRRTMIAGAPKL